MSASRAEAVVHAAQCVDRVADVGETAHVIANAKLGYVLGSFGIMAASVLPMAWRWQLLLRAKGVHDRIPWLTRAYFVSYAAGQVLPTSIGGDAVRIYETARRHPGQGNTAAASVLLERAIGGAATLMLAAFGFVLAVGHYDIGPYLWVEGIFVVATIVLGFLLFSRLVRPLLALGRRVLAPLRLDRIVGQVYLALHSYRENAGVLLGVVAVTLGVQAVRVLAIWFSGKAVGIDLSPRPYYVMGPLLFLVMLVPFTVNGLAVRESFFVSFLGGVGVDADRAFAAGFLFFVVTVVMAAPGALILAWEGLRGSGRAGVPREADG